MSRELLNIGRTGITTSQAQMGVTGHNIANINTKGYHRQSTEQSAHTSKFVDGKFLGAGSYVLQVQRVVNEFALKELQHGQTNLSFSAKQFEQLTQLDQIFSQLGNAVPESMNALYSSFANLSDMPTDMGIRTSIIHSADEVVKNVNMMQGNITNKLTQTQNEIKDITVQINQLSEELASINGTIMKSGEIDNQLLDKQNLLIQELSEYANISVVSSDLGSKNIMLGGSIMLVTGTRVVDLEVKEGEFFSDEVDLIAKTGINYRRLQSENIGGQLGAIFDIRDNTLIPTTLELDRLALGFKHTFNDIQHQGFDFYGQVGDDLFIEKTNYSVPFTQVGANPQNQGDASLAIEIVNINNLSAATYELKYTDADGYQLINQITHETAQLNQNANKLTGANGFDIAIQSGAMVDGDKFLIRPMAGAAASLALGIKDPKSIAAASYQIIPDADNLGFTSIKLANVNNRDAINFPDKDLAIELEIDSSNDTFTVYDKEGNSIQNGTFIRPNLSVLGVSFDISSMGSSIERFSLDLSFAQGDNRNALTMARLNESKLMDGGNASFTDLFEQIKLDIGSKTRTSNSRQAAFNTIFQQAEERVHSISGVNLDEEAANLMRFQQSFQASARVMTIAQQLFESLLNSIG